MTTTNAANVVAFPEDQVSLEEAFLRGLQTEATRREYRRALRGFSAFLDPKPMLAATRRDIEAYIAHLREVGRSPSTICKRLAALSGFFKFAYDEEAISRNPVSSVRRPKLPDCSPRTGLTPSEICSLFEATDSDKLIGVRDRALLAVLSYQGLRISEALGIEVDDLGEELGHKVVTVEGKGGKVARVPLAAPTWAAIQAWLDASGIEDGPIFCAVTKGGRVVDGKAVSPQSAWERVRFLARRGGLSRERVFPHLFRHAAATIALDSGVPLHQVQDFLRHASPVTTRRYDSLRQSLSNPSPHVLAARLAAGSA